MKTYMSFDIFLEDAGSACVLQDDLFYYKFLYTFCSHEVLFYHLQVSDVFSCVVLNWIYVLQHNYTVYRCRVSHLKYTMLKCCRVIMSKQGRRNKSYRNQLIELASTSFGFFIIKMRIVAV